MFLHCSGQLLGMEDRDADYFEEPLRFLPENHSLFNAKPGQLPHLWNLNIIQVEIALTSLKTG